VIRERLEVRTAVSPVKALEGLSASSPTSSQNSIEFITHTVLLTHTHTHVALRQSTASPDASMFATAQHGAKDSNH
jgi:hypothetical protein